MIFNIPTQFTQGDRVSWWEHISDYDPVNDILKVFIVGRKNTLTVTANGGINGFEFAIASTLTKVLQPGKYKAQFAIYVNGMDKTTLGSTDLLVCPSFENLSELETRTPDEIELEAVTEAIAKLSSKNVAEYYIGTRKVRYNDLASLYERQKYLRNRIAKSKNKAAIGGRNVGVGFRNW